MREKTIYEQPDDFIRDVCCLTCLDLADASRHLNRAIKDNDLKSENFWLRQVTNASHSLLSLNVELEKRRIEAMRDEIQKGEQIEPDTEVVKEKVDRRVRTNLHEEYELSCWSLFGKLVDMGDFNDEKEEKMFKDAKQDWDDLVAVREKLIAKRRRNENSNEHDR